MALRISFSLIFSIMLATILMSCTDIAGTEPNIVKEMRKMNPVDSLNMLIFQDIDLGELTYGKIKEDSLFVFNQSATQGIYIYNIHTDNRTGLFSYSATEGLPIYVSPLENIKPSGKLKVKFYAQSFGMNEYVDTLIFNNNPAYRIVIRAKVKSL